jgi:hypothetical protein
MTRDEQILNKAIDYSEIEENFLEYDDCGDVFDAKIFIEEAFIEGANWADEHPNLYNNEKYHTVKVSCLDELNRKATLYDEFLDKACEWIKNNKSSYKVWSFGSLHTDWDKFIREFRKAMEE